MNAWQQIEGKNENILKLETGKVGRCIQSATIPTHSGAKSQFDAHNTRLANINYTVTDINHLYSTSI